MLLRGGSSSIGSPSGRRVGLEYSRYITTIFVQCGLYTKYFSIEVIGVQEAWGRTEINRSGILAQDYNKFNVALVLS